MEATITREGGHVRASLPGVGPLTRNHWLEIVPGPGPRDGWQVRGANGDLGTLSVFDAPRSGLTRAQIVALVRALNAADAGPLPAPAERWEYAEMRGDASPVTLDALNEAGDDGWLLVDVFRGPAGDVLRALFRRPAPPR